MTSTSSNNSSPDQTPRFIRRQVSDLGMEDPVMCKKEDYEEPQESDAPSDGRPNIVDDDEDEDEEIDLDDLMSMSSPCTRSSLGGGSITLKAMSDSFSGNNSSTGSFFCPDDSTDFTDASGAGGRRKVPARAGSGYCRDRRSSDASNSSSDRRKYVRSGVVVSAAALREKRRSSLLNNSLTQLNNSRGPQ